MIFPVQPASRAVPMASAASPAAPRAEAAFPPRSRTGPRTGAASGVLITEISGFRPLSGWPRKFVGGSCGFRQRFVLKGVLLLVTADAVHEVAQVAGGEFPAERPGGLVVPVHEPQQGGGELLEAVEVVGGDDFLLD